MIRVKELWRVYHYKKKTVNAVQGISFEVNKGEIAAFLGPNGAGKTTTIKCLCGIIIPTKGEVRVCGQDPVKKPHRVAAHVGAILEGNRNINWKADPVENIRYFATRRGVPWKVAKKRAVEIVEMLGLSEKIGVPSEKLSRGMQQKVALGVALAHEPEVLLLDEPTLGLDYDASRFMIDYILKLKEQGKAILLTTHQLNIAEKLANRVMIIDRGKIVVDKTLEDLKKEASKNILTLSIDNGNLDKAKEKLQDNGFKAEKSGGALNVQYAEPEQLYKIMELLKPIPINGLKTYSPTLEDIFASFKEGNMNE